MYCTVALCRSFRGAVTHHVLLLVSNIRYATYLCLVALLQRLGASDNFITHRASDFEENVSLRARNSIHQRCSE